MTDESKAPWMNHTALATVVLAVCATLSTFKGGSWSTRSVISQAMASDQWGFFQAKSLKQHLADSEAETLRLQALSLPAGSPVAAAYAERIAHARAEAGRYAKEKAQIEAQARQHEAARDEAQHHSQPFGLAVIFLQISILLNSIAGLFKNQRIWWAAIPVALVGLGLFADGFLAWF